MFKKSIVALIMIAILSVLVYEPTALAAAAEASEGDSPDTMLRWTLNILSIATLGFLSYLIIFDRN
ncbi:MULTISPECIES: hypothetical protein [Shouchella]|uniref:Uncharacterized protein n=2 Tax=Shouchella TaxID=2893057 RepID=A0ABY7W4A2_9BACI|nr:MULTISPECIES: hypothetical protein [Shouchella]MED4127024.1 hypothetical protein [Shouchella miscanthi]WDF03513.1 hypothetical protein PQ477_18785 [Shouchella hunanensis]GAF23928.1 hypothetical protein JCM19047_3781 [Bacillus sp. JCM 19047]